MLELKPRFINSYAETFCREFFDSNRPKFILGTNAWAESIAYVVDVDGFIDDFTSEISYLGKPIVSMDDVPDNALVVSVVIGKPFVAEKRMRQFQFDSLDYYAFYYYAKLPIKQVMFWDGVVEEIERNFEKYQWVYSKLNDKVSKNQFTNIINFRYSYDLRYMRGFENKEREQYFEPFLSLKTEHESFVDIGAFDGYTTEEFIKRCPNFTKIFMFEPEQNNLENTRRRLEGYDKIKYFQKGLSNQKGVLRFEAGGSSSKISETGDLVIEVDRLDELIDEKVTFIKMDIEGAEKDALEGGKETIGKYHPTLAISVYHQKNDFWKIPELVFGIRSDYDLYLRHYTEGISETVMFFVPQNTPQIK